MYYNKLVGFNIYCLVFLDIFIIAQRTSLTKANLEVAEMGFIAESIENLKLLRFHLPQEKNDDLSK